LDGSRCYLGPGHIVRWVPSSPNGKEHSSRPPTFAFCGRRQAYVRINSGPCQLWPKGWMDQDVTWYAGRPWPRQYCFIWGPSYLSSKKSSTVAPTFSFYGRTRQAASISTATHVCCGETVKWMKMLLGMEVCVGPGDIVLDGNPAPPRKVHRSLPPLFSPCLLWPNGGPSQQLLS